MFKKVPVLLLYLLLPAVYSNGQSQFVKVKDHRFAINGKPYNYIGMNYWYGGLLALQKDPKRGKERLVKELDFLKAHGINNLRVLAGSEGTGMVNGVHIVKPSLQPRHGKYNIKVLNGLDYLLYQMEKRHMYAVLYLSNNWEWSGGFLQYLQWNKVISDSVMRRKMTWDEQRDIVSKFYTCNKCITDYRKQVSLIVKHINKYTGRSYTREPAIMAWELANEPRPMRPFAIKQYYKWASGTASLIKMLDRNHMVTLGTEGDMGTENADVFRTVHSFKQVDYLTIHIWPKNWSWFNDTTIAKSLPAVIGSTVDYIKKHEAIAEQLNKPLVLEEFGLPRDANVYSPGASTSSRDQYYTAVFSIWKKSVLNHGYIAGCNMWAYGGRAVPIPGQLFWKDGDDFMGDPPQEEQGLNSVFNTDTSTWKVILNYTQHF